MVTGETYSNEHDFRKPNFTYSVANYTTEHIQILFDIPPGKSCKPLGGKGLRLKLVPFVCRTEARKTAPRPSLMKLFKLLSQG